MNASQKRKAYVLAIGVALAVFAVRYGLHQTLGERALFLPFVLAVVVAAWLGGLGPGLLATGLAVVLTLFFIDADPLLMSVDGLERNVNVLIFVAIGVTISALCEALIATRRRELEQRIRMFEIAAEEDRKIGNELHDNTQQQLTGLGMLAQSLADSLTQKSIQEASTATRVAKGIHELSQQVHFLSQGLVPVDVDAEGLRAALIGLASTIREQYAVDCQFRCQGIVDLADNFVATNMYRIAQEAVNNAIRHGEPERIELSLSGTDKIVRMIVLDNGGGIVAARPASRGMGLRIMRYRAELIGGAVHIAHRNEGGTEVTCTVPRNNFKSS